MLSFTDVAKSLKHTSPRASKSYFQGLITGGVMVYAMFVLMGQQVQKAYTTTKKEALVKLQKSTEINKILIVGVFR